MRHVGPDIGAGMACEQFESEGILRPPPADRRRLLQMDHQCPPRLRRLQDGLERYVRPHGQGRMPRERDTARHARAGLIAAHFFTTIPCIPLIARGKTRRWITGMPTPQHNASKPDRSTNWRLCSVTFLSSRGLNPVISVRCGVARTRRRRIETPKEVRADFCASSSVTRCLKSASFFQTNSTLSPSSAFGESPSLRASVNLSSAHADRESSASSLHHAGQAGIDALSLRPARLRLRRSVFDSLLMPHYCARRPASRPRRLWLANVGHRFPL